MRLGMTLLFPVIFNAIIQDFFYGVKASQNAGDLILNSGEELKINTTAPSITFSSYNYTASLQNRSSLHGSHRVANIIFSGNIEFRSGSTVEVFGKYGLSITSLSGNVLIETDVSMICGETVLDTTCLGGFTQSSSPVMAGISSPKTDAIYEGMTTVFH
ncbi:hypothetical protein ACROYT_G013693 [Oculina patagonica]